MRFNGLLCAIAVASISGSALAGPDWTEIPDAGKLTPQSITLPIQPDSITGVLSGTDANGGPDVVDSYDLIIESGETFVATTSEMVPLSRSGPTNFNAALWLFRLDRTGLVANRDINTEDDGARLFSMPTDGTPVQITTPPGGARFILAVSYNDVSPVTTNGQPIFDFMDGAGPFQVSGPDGVMPGMPGMFGQWQPLPAGRPPVKYRIRILGRCGQVTQCPGDADLSGTVNFTDITTVLANLGAMCN